ncbi:unnamed protein product [Cylicostephanus goldi]|uniref:Uncharacterized protein n=1 Tax=Cylicostephanus goldi TaxID=71465 RepID=A0A3P7M425_CYLGO|nr:unnamed protein product [Cylicostephanus goldi]
MLQVWTPDSKAEGAARILVVFEQLDAEERRKKESVEKEGKKEDEKKDQKKEEKKEGFGEKEEKKEDEKKEEKKD